MWQLQSFILCHMTPLLVSSYQTTQSNILIQRPQTHFSAPVNSFSSISLFKLFISATITVLQPGKCLFALIYGILLALKWNSSHLDADTGFSFKYIVFSSSSHDSVGASLLLRAILRSCSPCHKNMNDIELNSIFKWFCWGSRPFLNDLRFHLVPVVVVPSLFGPQPPLLLHCLRGVSKNIPGGSLAGHDNVRVLVVFSLYCLARGWWGWVWCVW